VYTRKQRYRPYEAQHVTRLQMLVRNQALLTATLTAALSHATSCYHTIKQPSLQKGSVQGH
jgi:hypothetical protein